MSRTWETLGVLSAKRRKRLVSTSPDNTEIICALGGYDDLVGVSKHCDYPEGIATEKPIISDFATADLEKIADLKPDVVFCSTYYQADMIKQLVGHHFRVFVTQPSTLAAVYDNILLITNLIGRPDKGEMLVESMQHALTPQPERGLKVFAEEWGDPIVHAAPWIHEMIRLAGGDPVLPELMAHTHTNGRIVTPQQVLETQADVVLLPWCGVHGRVPLHKVLGRPGWESLPAVRKNQVFPLEDSFYVRPGPRLVQGYKMLIELFETCQ